MQTEGSRLKKVFIFPTSSLVLADLVERFGHEPLTLMEGVRRARKRGGRIRANTEFDPRRGLRWAPVELPSGVRGRLAVIGPLIEEADAAVIMQGADFGFGCSGCARTNELIPYIISQQGIPYVIVPCPIDEESARAMVSKVQDFLTKLEA